MQFWKDSRETLHILEDECSIMLYDETNEPPKRMHHTSGTSSSGTPSKFWNPFGFLETYQVRKGEVGLCKVFCPTPRHTHP